MQPKRLTFPLVAVLLALLVVPAVAHAEEALSPACILAAYPATFPKASEECAQEHKVAEEKAAEEAAKAAAKAAAEAAKKAEEQAPATRLELKVFSRHGSSYAEPGFTAISITAAPYVRITFTGNHGGGTSHFRLLPGHEGITEPTETGAVYETYAIKSGSGLVPGAAGINVRWSCHLRGQAIHFTVEALGGSGPPLVRTGYFEIALSARWCAQAKETEEAAKLQAKRRAEEERRAEEHACDGRPCLNTERIAQAIEKAILEARDIEATVACPSREPQRVGVVFFCQAYERGHDTPFEVTVRTEGGYVTFVAR